MITAINKDGRMGTFSDRVWALMPKHKNGWMLFNGDSKEPVIPEEIIEFQAKKKEVAVAPKAKTQDEEIAEMKAYLDSIEVKYHHKIGYDKLKALYDVSKK